MMGVIGYSYFLIVTQDYQSMLRTNLLSNSNALQQSQEHLTVTGTVKGPVLAVIVNNTGTRATISSFFVTDQSTGEVLQFNSGSSSTPALPYALAQGKSVEITTSVFYTAGHSYIIKLLTSRGSTFVTTYPGKQLNDQIASSLVAAGLGSVSMVFSSYTFYNVTEKSNVWSIETSYPEPGGLVPYDVTPGFSMVIENNDPNTGTIVLNSHTDLYLYNSCPKGCGGQVPMFVYYIVNVGANGVISSTSQGSFVPIVIPYGTNQTVYFASANDLSLNSFASLQISGVGQKVAIGEYDVFIVLSGSDTITKNSVLYSQNLPFAASFIADNVAWVTETPVSCTQSAKTSFSLTVTNAEESTSDINSVSINATGFTSLKATKPNSWSTPTISGTDITWSGGNINTGRSLTFSWSGTAPSTVGTQEVFVITIYFDNHQNPTVLEQSTAAGCFIV